MKGVVTKFTFKTFSQGQVWVGLATTLRCLRAKISQGGMIVYGGHVVDQVTAATASFSAQSTDPKAQIITLYTYISGLVSLEPMPFRGRIL